MAATKFNGKFSQENLTRVNRDINGNPRYVFSFFWLGDTMEEALELARKFGGKKYRGKDFGGGIVVTDYAKQIVVAVNRLRQRFDFKIETFDGWNDLFNGTHRQSQIRADYALLVELFGEPTEGDGYKVDAEWLIKINDEPITIYNYKSGKNYNGRSGTATKKIIYWNIGGFTPKAGDLINDYLTICTQSLG